MRKNLLIGSGIVILLLLISVFLQPKPEVKIDDHDKPYISLSREQAVLDYKWKDMFVTKNDTSNAFQVYQIIGNPSDRVSYQKYKDEMPNVVSPTFDKVAEVMFFFTYSELTYKGNLSAETAIIDTLKNQNFINRKSIFKNADNFEGRRYLNENNDLYWSKSSNDLFTRIDDSIFVFIFISFIPFLILIFHDLILYIIKARPFSIKYHGWQILLLLLTVLFFYNMVTPASYAANKLSGFINYNLLFFSIYIIYQYLIKTILKYEHAWKKAIILLALCIVCSLGSTLIARFIDSAVYNSDGYTILAQRPIYFELGFLFSFVLGNFFNNLRKSYFAHRRRSKELDSSQDRVLASEAALNSIQASVNPHFLYNSLNAIASLAKSDPDKTEAMALALSNFYKYQTNRKSEPLTSLSEELEMIDNYLAIEKIRFGDRLQYRLQIDAESESKKIPHFILQPLLENAVKYGYNTKSEKIDITLSIKSMEKELLIQLFDNGRAFSEDLDSGYGLRSVMKKLQLFYPDRHSIDFINTPIKHVAISIQNA